MKTHTIKTPTAELLIVELPNRTADFSVLDAGETLAVYAFTEYYDLLDMERIPKGYTLLGKPDEIREDDAAKLIPMYFDHEKTAVEYLIQMMESEIYWVNPYREKVFVNMDISASMVRAANRELYSEKWQEAELRTFDRSRTLIFVKQ